MDHLEAALIALTICRHVGPFCNSTELLAGSCKSMIKPSILAVVVGQPCQSNYFFPLHLVYRSCFEFRLVLGLFLAGKT